MEKNTEVIIIGGSYAGLSAAMALGRSMRNVLIIDSGLPCNRQTPHSHNFITHDGTPPNVILSNAKSDVQKYSTIKWITAIATGVAQTESGFEVTTNEGKAFNTKKVLIATGLKDIMPPIGGFAECWGISVLHCPYCHGFEVRGMKTAVIGNGDLGFEFAKMISHWTKDLVLLTNGVSTLTGEQRMKIESRGIEIIESELESIVHDNGYVERVNLADGGVIDVKAIYAKLPFVQHSDIPEKLGCEFTESGVLKVDNMQKTTIKGVFAAGDNANAARSLSFAVASGTLAGVSINRELIEESFLSAIPAELEDFR